MLYTTWLPLHPRKAMHCVSWAGWQAVHYDLSLPTFTRSGCNRHWSRRRQHWLIARMYYSFIVISGMVWYGSLWALYVDLTRRHSVIHLTPRNLRQQITSPFINRTIFRGNRSQMGLTADTHIFLCVRQLIFTVKTLHNCCHVDKWFLNTYMDYLRINSKSNFSVYFSF